MPRKTSYVDKSARAHVKVRYLGPLRQLEQHCQDPVNKSVGANNAQGMWHVPLRHLELHINHQVLRKSAPQSQL